MNQWLEDWLAARAESYKTKDLYERLLQIFADYVETNYDQSFDGIVEKWRFANKAGNGSKEEFLLKWGDVVRSFNTYIKKRYAPLTVKNFLTVLRSFFGFWDIPVKVHLPKRACVIYHNRDLTKEVIKQILTFASPRDRVMWLVMAESGMRAGAVVNMKYWQIKEDFEARKVPMRIMLPSSSLKDHVGDRWTFIGEDGYRDLREYLELRLPLKDDDYVFVSEKPGKVRGKQFSVASLSVKFSRVVLKLELDKPRGNKPKGIRMHGLRKYFRNNMKADSAYLKFWMGHTMGVDEHYISRDVEQHRSEYAKGYQFLQISEPSEHYATMANLEEQLAKKEQEIRELRGTLGKLQPLIDFAESFKSSEQLESFLTVLKQSMGGKTPTMIVHIDPEFMEEDVAVESLKQLYQRCYDLEKEKRQKKSRDR